MPKPTTKVILPDAPRVPVGYKRRWMWCRKCNEISYYDFIPGDPNMPSLENTCGHDFIYDLEYLNPDQVEGGLPQ